MTKQQLAERYKEIEIKQITDDILEVNLWKDKTHPFEQRVKILFAYDKLYFTGDFTTFVFGKYVYGIKTFFQGEKINPYYWMEKCEASSEPLLNEDIELEECRQKVTDYLYENLDAEKLDEFESQQEIEDTLYNLEDYYIHAADRIEDLFTTLGIDDDEAGNEAWSIVHDCRPYSEYYLYACETIQWVENNLDKWISENPKDCENNEKVKTVLSDKTHKLEENQKCQS